MPLLLLLFILALASSCTVVKPYTAYKKYTPTELREDFTVFENILKQEHPGIYWYTPSDSMQYYFNGGRAQLTDSMTEIQFRYLLSYITSKIRCGHTTVSASRRYYSSRDSLH